MIKAAIATFVTAIILDLVWIGFIANKFYKSQVGSIMRLKEDGSADVMLIPALLVYLLITAGMVFFVLPKVTPEQSTWTILPWGFLFGIVLYGVYDFTNLALLKDYTIPMAVVDWIWGGVICAISAVAANYATKIGT